MCCPTVQFVMQPLAVLEWLKDHIKTACPKTKPVISTASERHLLCWTLRSDVNAYPGPSTTLNQPAGVRAAVSIFNIPYIQKPNDYISIIKHFECQHRQLVYWGLINVPDATWDHTTPEKSAVIAQI